MPNPSFIEQEIERRIRARRLPLVQSIWQRKGRFDRHWRNEKGESFLHIALFHYEETVFDWLYEQFENDEVIFTLDAEGRSLIWHATKKHLHELAMKLLTSQFASEKFTDHPERTAWMRPDKQGVSVFHLAAQETSTELLEFFISYLPEGKKISEIINQADKKGKTLLHFACDAKALDMIVWLINHDADMYALDHSYFHFFTWFINHNPPIFDKLNQDKQWQILSYLRTWSSHDDRAKALYAKLATDGVEEELNTYQQSHIKTLNQVLDDDKRTLEGLIKKADTHWNDLQKRPFYLHDTFFSRHYMAIAKLCLVLSKMAVGFCIALGIAGAILFALTNPIITVGIGISMAVSIVIGLIAAPVTWDLLRKLGESCLNPSLTEIPTSPGEFSAFAKEIDTTFLQKCKHLENGMMRFTASYNLYHKIRKYDAGWEGISVLKAQSRMGVLKETLEKFLPNMLRIKRPFSSVPALLAKTTETEKLTEHATETLADASTHWAALHTATTKTVQMEKTDISDLEMAYSPFGKYV